MLYIAYILNKFEILFQYAKSYREIQSMLKRLQTILVNENLEPGELVLYLVFKFHLTNLLYSSFWIRALG